VLAITHLAQVASSADHHWVVSKLRSESGSQSMVSHAQGAAREVEIARMLGGESDSEVSMAHAKEMLSSKRMTDQGNPPAKPKSKSKSTKPNLRSSAP
jgi:DNA repair protein RecN (Recombination protein N)